MWDDGGFCKLCPYFCETCTIGDACTKCKGIREIDNGCKCPAGYLDKGVAQCFKCNFRCLTCEAGETECTECADSRTGIPECKTCPPGKYDDGVNVDC